MFDEPMPVSQEDIIAATLAQTIQTTILNQEGYKFMFLPIMGPQSGLNIQWEPDKQTIWAVVGGWGYPFIARDTDPDALNKLAHNIYSFYQLAMNAKPMGEANTTAKPLDLGYAKRVQASRNGQARPPKPVQNRQKINESECPHKTLFAQITEELGIIG